MFGAEYKKTYLYPITITSNSGTEQIINFVNDGIIANKQILSIEVLSASDLAAINGTTVIADTELDSVVLNIYSGTEQIYYQQPGTLLNRRINGGILAYTQHIRQFNMALSNITLTVPSDFTVGNIIPLIFNYIG